MSEQFYRTYKNSILCKNTTLVGIPNAKVLFGSPTGISNISNTYKTRKGITRQTQVGGMSVIKFRTAKNY